MKKLLLIFCTALLFASCKNEAILVPTGLMLEETDITLVVEGETYNNRVYTNSPFLNIIIPESDQEWLSATIEGDYLVIKCERNPSLWSRTTNITINADTRGTSIKVTQNGSTTKVNIVSGSSNSTQNGPSATNNAVHCCYDGDLTTTWYNNYSAGDQNNPIVYWLLFTLEPGAPSLDLVYLLPRQGPGFLNGRFSKFGIWVKGDGTDIPSIAPGDTDDSGKAVDGDAYSGWGGLIGSVDSEGFKLVYKGDMMENTGFPYNAALVVDGVNPYNDPHYGELVRVNNPTQVLVRIPGGGGTSSLYSEGGYAVLTEIAFYNKAL